MSPEQKAKTIKRKPWKFCRVCQVEIKSPTGYCHEHWIGDRWTASPYGLVNVGMGGYRVIEAGKR